MKFRGQDPLPYRITGAEPERRFVDETPVPDGVIRFTHRIEPLADGHVRLTHTVEIEGPEGFAQHLGPMITADVPATMTRLAELAQTTA